MSSKGGPCGEDGDGQPTGKDGAGTLGWEEGALSRAGIDSSVWALGPGPGPGLSPASVIQERLPDGRLATGSQAGMFELSREGTKIKVDLMGRSWQDGHRDRDIF